MEIRDQILEATALLERVARDPSLLAGLTDDERARLHKAAGDAFQPDVAERRQWARDRKRQQRREKIRRDEERLSETGIRRLRAKPVFTTPNVFAPEEIDEHAVGADVADDRHCYSCKTHFTRLHHFYDQLCTACGGKNFAKRTQSADLSGHVALLTGGRVKIGYQAGIKLLRAGAHLVVTTRFPRDAATRYAGEPDFSDWSDRLEIFGVDLRHTPSVENFCRHLHDTHGRLDFIVNNACQTVRRPPEFYEHMMDLEHRALAELPRAVQALLGEVEDSRGLAPAARLSQTALLPGDAARRYDLFPAGQLDQDLQQVDLRGRNSWRLTLGEVATVEMLETQLVNAVAPFVLNARLKPLMLRTQGRHKHIVNVSAVEGQFYRRFKTTKHPHTNMAKAALNMMTRTSAADYHADGIHMNSVDTGWVSDEDPAEIARSKRAEHRFHPPLDIVDGAARIVDPIFAGFNTGRHVYGQFLKDYEPTDW